REGLITTLGTCPRLHLRGGNLEFVVPEPPTDHHETGHQRTAGCDKGYRPKPPRELVCPRALRCDCQAPGRRNEALAFWTRNHAPVLYVGGREDGPAARA